MQKPLSFNRTYNKKAGLHYCRSTYRGSGIAFRYKQQHRSPRRMYNIIRYTQTRAYTYIHTIGILVSQCFVTLYEIYQIPVSQNKAR